LPAPRHTSRSDLQLRRLSDDELVGYLRDARATGDIDGARLALQMLIFGYMDHVRSRVALKVPRHVVDEVAGQAMISAVAAAFRGGSLGEFRSWLHTIVDRRIADYHRAGKVDLVPLAVEHDVIASLEDETGAVAVQNVIEAAMAELGDVHRMVVDRYVFDGLSAEEASRAVAEAFPSPPNRPISPDNVHKIAQRFRDRVRTLLDSESVA
jgi:DNA-directed RNA polymerase specialized sigma24 family protein